MLEIKIRTENAAYEDNPYEIVRNLRDIANKIEFGYTEGSVMDINGNKTGEWKYEKGR